MLLRARIVLPITRPPLEDGAVRVVGDRIAWAGRWSEVPAGERDNVVDLGEAILLPGLINAHCHLDYTGMAGMLSPQKSFTQWIQGMVALKAAWNPADFANSWRQGAEMLLRSGTTTVADVETVPEHVPQIWAATPLRVISFRELIRLQGGGAGREAVDTAVAEWSAVPDDAGRLGLSPHAPYTTTKELLEAAAAAAQAHRWLLTTHVAESEEEFEMFMYRHGPMYDWLKGQRVMDDCGVGSPVQHLERCGYLEANFLAVHVNYLWRHDAGILGRNQVSVAHCPRSHDYFRHLKFSCEDLEQAGVNICLGTDSLATVRKVAHEPLELSLFAEMRMLAAQASGLAPEQILNMATVNGARALRRQGQLGEITEHAAADLIALPFTGSAKDVFHAIVHHEGPVSASMIGGRWAWQSQPSELDFQ